MFVGAYWQERRESKASSAGRISAFLGALAQCDSTLANWYAKGRTKREALRTPMRLDVISIAARLVQNRNDVDRKPIEDLGFRFSAWNGSDASLSAKVGCYSPYVLNTAVLSLDQIDRSSKYGIFLTHIVAAFDPVHAVVTSSEYLESARAQVPWAAGLMGYERGVGFRDMAK